MKNQALESFGRALMAEVRDQVYEKYQAQKAGRYASENSEKRRKLISRIQDQDALDGIVRHVIDAVLFRTLAMLEENDASLAGEWDSFSARDDSDGLCGELFGGDGWIKRFSAYEPSMA